MAALQASQNAHPPQADCAFESACALPSGVIRGCETTSIRRRISGGFSATKEESGEDEQLEAMTD